MRNINNVLWIQTESFENDSDRNAASEHNIIQKWIFNRQDSDEDAKLIISDVVDYFWGTKQYSRMNNLYRDMSSIKHDLDSGKSLFDSLNYWGYEPQVALNRYGHVL